MLQNIPHVLDLRGSLFTYLETESLSWYSDWLRDGQPGFDFCQRQETCFYSTAFSVTLGPTQPPIHWISGTIYSRVKLQGGEADHSPPSDTEVKNVELYLHAPIRLNRVVLI
jgi:hypothetical protein